MYINLKRFILVIFLLSLLLIPQNGLAQKDKVQNKVTYGIKRQDRNFDVKGSIGNGNQGNLAPNSVTYINENFETASVVTPPAGWTQNIIQGVQGTDLWHFDNPGSRTLHSPITQPAAIFDSDHYSHDSTPENVALESPGFSPPASSSVMLEWDQYFLSGAGGAINVEVWNGATWSAAYTSNITTPNPEHKSVDISAASAGISDVRVRFRWTGNWSKFWIIDNILVYEPGLIPDPAVVVSPADGVFDVDINTSLKWISGGGNGPTGYRLYFGTDGEGVVPPSNIENNTDLQLVVEYTPSAPLLYATTYYWMIVPYNDNGDAEGNEIWSFTVMEDPPVTIFPYSENFEGSYPPMYYIRYTGLLADPVTLTSTSSGWVQDDWRNQSSPVNKAASLNISGNNINHWLTTTLLDFNSASDYQLEFDLTLNASGTSDPPETSGSDDRFAVVISTDSGKTWELSNILMLWDNTGSDNIFNNISSSGEHITIDLSAYVGMVQIGFYGESSSANANNDLMIDNIEITEQPALIPVFSIDPPNINFGQVAVGNTSVQHVTVTNSGNADLIINNITSSDPQFTFSPASFPVTIIQGEHLIFDIEFTPAEIGSQTASLEFTHNAAGSPDTYSVQGIGADEGPTLSISPSTLNFGNVGVNTSNDLPLTVSNIGLTNPLSITDASISGTGFSVNPASANIPAGGSRIFTVTFNPGSSGSYSGSLVFISNDPASPNTIPLTGNASEGKGLKFGNKIVYQLEDDSYTQTMNLTGLDPLGEKIQAIQFRLTVNKATDDNTILTFQNIQKGTDVADANWVLDYNLFRGPLTGNGASVDSIYVLLYNLDQQNGLDPAVDYDDLLTVKYRIADLPALTDTLKSSVKITHASATTLDGYPVDISSIDNNLTVMAVNRISSLGDVNGDGYLDILDLILVVDHIVGRDSLEGDFFTRADISPWTPGTQEPEPDGIVNVQDLSLMQNIILNGVYPNDQLNKSGSNQGILKIAGDVDAKVILYINGEGISVYIDSKVDIRGIQIELKDVNGNPSDMSISTELGQGFYKKTADLLRTLLYDRLADRYIKAGEHFAADMPFIIKTPEDIQADKIILVGMDRRKLEKITIEIIYGKAPELPLDYILFQNYPNPFNPSTTIKFQVPQTSDVTIKIFNMLGQEIRTLFAGQVLRGTHTFQWDGLNNSNVKMSSGTYIYRMIAGSGNEASGSFVQSNKMILLK